MAIVLPRGLLKNYTDENVRHFLLIQCRVVAVVGLSGDMFKPFTNTKTCVVFLQKRLKPLKNVDEANKDKSIAFCQTTRPGKDKSGILVRNNKGEIVSDLPDITKFINKNAVWL